jgi:hypothetical protein
MDVGKSDGRKGLGQYGRFSPGDDLCQVEVAKKVMAARTGFERLKTSAVEQSAATFDDIVECCEETGPARLIFCDLASSH